MNLLRNSLKTKKSFGIINQKYFSTLIVPDIIGNKLHTSIHNLSTAATSLGEEVKYY